MTETDHGPGPAPTEAYDIDYLVIAQWCPTLDSSGPPTQVHMQIHVKGVKTPLVMRFKSSFTITRIIGQLTRHRNEVWPGMIPTDPPTSKADADNV